MSTCGIVTFKDGVADSEMEFPNAWGGAAYIWTCLWDKYCKDPRKEYDSWLLTVANGDRRLWDLAHKPELPLFERAVHASTFDRFIVRRENFPQFIAHLREFDEAYKKDGFSHVSRWADAIEKFDETVEAIGFHATSVTECLFYNYGEDGECVPYRLEQGEHKELYEFLNENHDGEEED